MNATDVKYHSDQGIDVLGSIIGLAQKQASAIVVRHGQAAISYAELVGLINRVAQGLYQNMTDGDRLVGMMLDRDERLPAAFLGAWRAAKAYIPLDATLPDARISAMMQQARCQWVLCSQQHTERVQRLGFHALSMDEVIRSENSVLPAYQAPHTDDLAYVIFTSGSSGVPKGVMISHGNVGHFLQWSISEFGKAPFTTLLAGTSVSFDLSVFELYLPLLLQKELLVLESNLDIGKAMENEKQVMVNTVPSLINELLELEADFSNVTVLNMAGESIPENLIKRLRKWPGMEIRNLYGPSECTTYVTMYKFNGSNQVLIGTVLEGNKLYLLNDRNEPVADGETGQIHISGKNVALGYINAPGATAKSFSFDPLNHGERMYATGDYGSFTPGGVLSYKGRVDQQIKLRGYRIELREIEAAMEAVPGVGKAVVTVFTGDDDSRKQLVGYYTGDRDITRDEWKHLLKTGLPLYMVPETFVHMPSFPLNANGKVEKAALPIPADITRQEYDSYSGGNAKSTEAKLRLIWRDVLGLSMTDDEDHFFEKGGHSLKAFRLVGRLFRELNIRAELADLYKTPRFKDFLGVIEKRERESFDTLPLAPDSASFPLAPAQLQCWLRCRALNGNEIDNIGFGLILRGKLHIGALRTAINHLIERHPALRTTIEEEEGMPRQIISRKVSLTLEVEPAPTGHDFESIAAHLLQQEITTPFQLDKGPLIRSRLIGFDRSSHCLLIVIHHIICDGWSIEILMDELMAAYQCYASGHVPEFAPLGRHYRDYVHWVNSKLDGPGWEACQAYWNEQLSGVSRESPFPEDKFAGSADKLKGKVFPITCPPVEMHAVMEACASLQSSRFGFVTAGLALLIYRYTGQRKVLLGLPVAGRSHIDLENIVGMFLNIIPGVIGLKEDLSFSALLKHVNEQVQAGLKYQDYPFGTINRNWQLTDASESGRLFPAGLTWQNYSDSFFENARMGDMDIKVIQPSFRFIDRPIWFFGTEFSDHFHLSVLYNGDHYHESSISLLSDHLRQILAEAAANPEKKLGQFMHSDTGVKPVQNEVNVQFDF